eukprot:4789081-Pleurochrysis_carterae.AAC.2
MSTLACELVPAGTERRAPLRWRTGRPRSTTAYAYAASSLNEKQQHSVYWSKEAQRRANRPTLGGALGTHRGGLGQACSLCLPCAERCRPARDSASPPPASHAHAAAAYTPQRTPSQRHALRKREGAYDARSLT